MPKAVCRKVLHIGFPKKRNHALLVEKFSEVFKILRKGGKHLEILTKYNRADDIVFFNKLVIGADREEYKPYSYWKDGKQKGICSQIINEAAKKLEVTIEYKEVPWQTFPYLIKKGEIHAIMPVFKNPERLKYMYFPDTGMVVERNYFFALEKNHIKYSGDLEDLKRYTIGVVRNYSYGNFFDDAYFPNKKAFDNVKTLVENVDKGYLQVGIGSEWAVKNFRETLEIKNRISFLRPFLPLEFLYLAFSKKGGARYEKISRSFSSEFKRMHESGRIQEIAGEHELEKRTIKLAANNWQPYYGENLENFGPLAEIIVEAFKRVDYQVKVNFFPWPNLLNKVESGLYDGGFTAYKTGEREKLFFFSVPITKSSPVVFYKLKDSAITYDSLVELKHYRIGVARGFLYPPVFENTPGLQRIVSDDPKTSLDNLLRERLDLVIIDKLHAGYLLKTFTSRAQKALTPISLSASIEDSETKMDLHLVISKKTKVGQNIVTDFNEGLNILKKEGTFDKILKKHGFTNDKYTN